MGAPCATENGFYEGGLWLSSDSCKLLSPLKSPAASGKSEKEERERENELEVSQLVSVRTHQFQVMFLQRDCQGASSSCLHREQGRSLTVPVLTLHTHYSGRICCSPSPSRLFLSWGLQMRGWALEEAMPLLVTYMYRTELLQSQLWGWRGTQSEGTAHLPKGAFCHTPSRHVSVFSSSGETRERINFLFMKTSHDWK